MILHLACKNRHQSLCRYLLLDDNYKDLLLFKKSVQEFRYQRCNKNGLNFFDIACIHDNTEMCEDLMIREDLKLSLDKYDAHG